MSHILQLEFSWIYLYRHNCRSPSNNTKRIPLQWETQKLQTSGVPSDAQSWTRSTGQEPARGPINPQPNHKTRTWSSSLTGTQGAFSPSGLASTSSPEPRWEGAGSPPTPQPRRGERGVPTRLLHSVGRLQGRARRGSGLCLISPLPLYVPPGTIIKRKLQKMWPKRSLFLLSPSGACRVLILNSVSITDATLTQSSFCLQLPALTAAQRQLRWQNTKPGTFRCLETFICND